MNEKLSIRFCLDDWADQHPQKIAVCTDGRISAFIKLNADSSSTQESIRQQLEQHIAKYKLPDHIIILDEIPKLPSGKYDYPKLSAMLN